MEANDDLLSFELGDDLDDQELAADEDALLLSDEEAQLDFEEDLLKLKENSSTQVQSTQDHVRDCAAGPDDNLALSSTQETPVEHYQSTLVLEEEVDNDEDRVSSTNECTKDAESDCASATPVESNDADASTPKKGARDDLDDYSSFDNDDEPSGSRERYNPKTTSERDQMGSNQNSAENNNMEFRGRNQQSFQRRGGIRGGGGGGPPFRGGRFGRGGYGNNNPPGQFYPNENFNPMNGDYGGHPGPNPMMNNRMPGPSPMMHMSQAGPGGMRPDFRQNPNMMPQQQQGNFSGRPPFPNDARLPRPMMRPPFDMANPQQQQPRFGGPMNSYRPHPGMPDQMNLGPRSGRPQFPGNNFNQNNFNRMHGQPQPFAPPQAMPPYQQQQQPPQRPTLMNRPPMHPQMANRMPMGPINASGIGMAAIAPSTIAPILPRKVLINPNFKGGGVEAATNQLMKDTLGNPQMITAMSDEALLRQQEEFINKNRMHIEKRRHDRSPEPRKREYSPPSHRERPPAGRYRRGGHSPPIHRDSSGRLSPKRRRSMDGPAGSSAMAAQPDPDEDEETRVYRLKIEKQKAMRDKILRDKEMRRRKAAERKDAVEAQEAVVMSPEKERLGSPKRLVPLVVTQKKIILRKNQVADSSAAAVEPHKTSVAAVSTTTTAAKRVVLQRARLPGSAGTVKPVVIKSTAGNESDEFDEDELLADSPPPQQKRSLTPPTPPIISSTTRRIVVANSRAGSSSAALTATKGIFDRLEKRVGVNETAKRKLKRIVIKNVE